MVSVWTVGWAEEVTATARLAQHALLQVERDVAAHTAAPALVEVHVVAVICKEVRLQVVLVDNTKTVIVVVERVIIDFAKGPAVVSVGAIINVVLDAIGNFFNIGQTTVALAIRNVVIQIFLNATAAAHGACRATTQQRRVLG